MGYNAREGVFARARSIWFLLPVLVLATLAVYYPAWHGGMLWDDDAHITRVGLRSISGLYRIWFDLGATQQYYPVLHSSFWMLHKVFGDNTFGYHVISMLLHAMSAFVVALILRKLAVPGVWLAALIFALHPVQVESVAWISELKNTLSGIFCLSAALAYLHFDESRQRKQYALAMLLFILALLSKSVTATLPAVLLVIFWWRPGRQSLRRHMLLFVPFFGLGIAGGLLTAWVERTLIGARGPEFQLSLIERCLVAGRAIWFYFAKLLWPENLTFIYPRWQTNQNSWWQILFPAAALGVLAAFWLLRKRVRAPLAAMLIFCGILFPALGFFDVYPFRYSFVADHFQYLACIAVVAPFAAALSRLAARWNIGRVLSALVILIFVGLLGSLTWRQSRQYSDAETLYRATLDRNPSCWLAHNNLGYLKIKVDSEEAVAHLKEALRLKPDYAVAHCNLCSALQTMGRYEDAKNECMEALRITPNLAEAHNNLGNTLQLLGRDNEAISSFKEALRIMPDFAVVHYNLANTLQMMDRTEEAITHYLEALALGPDSPYVHHNLGIALETLDRFQEAAVQYELALQLKPDYASARTNLSRVLAILRKGKESDLN